MPANLSPEYKKAEQAFREAHEVRERLVCLKEMLAHDPEAQGWRGSCIRRLPAVQVRAAVGQRRIRGQQVGPDHLVADGDVVEAACKVIGHYDNGRASGTCSSSWRQVRPVLLCPPIRPASRDPPGVKLS